jgi:hypothetical protein
MQSNPPITIDRYLTVSFRDILTWWRAAGLIEMIEDYNTAQDFLPPSLTAEVSLIADLTRRLEAISKVVQAGLTGDAPVADHATLSAIDRKVRNQLEVVGYLAYVQQLPLKAVDKRLHFCWSGGPLRDSAVANIVAWARLATRAGWEVTVWTDEVKKTWPSTITTTLKQNKVNIRDVNEKIMDHRLWDSYKLLVRGQKPNYPAGSDLARYSILAQLGGVYVDVDIAPGELYDLDRLAAPVRLPLLAPQMRDMKWLRAHLRVDPKAPLTQAHVMRCARAQLAVGMYNNNFIACPAGSPAMTAIITAAQAKIDMDVLADSPEAAAAVTGPEAVKRGLIQYLIDALKVRLDQAADIITLAAHHDLPLAWVTPESEFQEH